MSHELMLVTLHGLMRRISKDVVAETELGGVKPVADVGNVIVEVIVTW